MSVLVTRLLDAVPEAHHHNRRVLLAATLRSVFAGDFDRAESRLAGAAPVDDLDAFYLAYNQAQIFQNRLHTDRSTDAEYRQVALAHCERLVSDARERGAPLTLAIAFAVYGYCLDAAGDINAAVAVESEVIELAERFGVGFIVDVARASLVYSLAKLATSEPGQRHDTVATLRATIEAAITRRNQFVIADCLSCAVERVLWDAGDHRTAALLGKFGKLHLPLNELYPSAVDPALLGADALAEIEAEAAKLDIGTAGAIALAALDQILATG